MLPLPQSGYRTTLSPSHVYSLYGSYTFPYNYPGFHHYSFVISFMLYRWNHIVCSILLRFAEVVASANNLFLFCCFLLFHLLSSPWYECTSFISSPVEGYLDHFFLVFGYLCIFLCEYNVHLGINFYFDEITYKAIISYCFLPTLNYVSLRFCLIHSKQYNGLEHCPLPVFEFQFYHLIVVALCKLLDTSIPQFSLPGKLG